METLPEDECCKWSTVFRFTIVEHSDPLFMLWSFITVDMQVAASVGAKTVASLWPPKRSAFYTYQGFLKGLPKGVSS
jgi:hypothetical protein